MRNHGKNSLKERISNGFDLNDPKGAFGLYIRYKANGTPFYVLVTPDGKITDIWYGYNKDSLSERLKQGIK